MSCIKCVFCYYNIRSNIKANKPKQTQIQKQAKTKNKLAKKKNKTTNKKKLKKSKTTKHSAAKLKTHNLLACVFLFNLLDIATVSILHANLTFILSE